MELQEQSQKSLHNRVSDYLRGKATVDGVSGSQEGDAITILEMLHQAEADLRAAEAVVARLRLELDKANS